MTMANPIAGLGATIQRQSTTGQAAGAIRDAILAGRIPPGTPLREAALATELSVSRNTIREAARILESEGLVCYQMNRGIVVAEVTADDVRDIYTARAAAELAGADALTTDRDPVVYQKLADQPGRPARAVHLQPRDRRGGQHSGVHRRPGARGRAGQPRRPR
jgi:DNA-binding GntR family transcriptional regulator